MGASCAIMGAFFCVMGCCSSWGVYLNIADAITDVMYCCFLLLMAAVSVRSKSPTAIRGWMSFFNTVLLFICGNSVMISCIDLGVVAEFKVRSNRGKSFSDGFFSVYLPDIAACSNMNLRVAPLLIVALLSVFLSLSFLRGMSIRKKLRFGSVSMVALGLPFLFSSSCIVGIPVALPSVKSSSFRKSPSLLFLYRRERMIVAAFKTSSDIVLSGPE